MTQILALTGTLLGLAATISEIYSRIQLSRNQDIVEQHRYDIEVFNIVENAIARKDVEQQHAALALVNSLPESDLKKSLSTQLVSSGIAKRIGSSQQLTESQIFRRFDKIDTRKEAPMGLDQMATIVRPLNIRFFWCSSKRPYDDEHSDASSRQAVALEIARQLYGPAGSNLVTDLTDKDNLKPKYGVFDNRIRYKKGLYKVADDLSVESGSAGLLNIEEARDNMDQHDMEIFLCGSVD